MQSRSSDHETKPENPEPSDPPAAVSNQNQEEAEGADGSVIADGSAIRCEYRPGGRTRGDGDEDADPGSGSGSGSGERPGAASEGSQATGHPQNAG
jgi:hypothetical protein